MDLQEEVKERKVVLPGRKIYKTPRLLLGDAYTIGSNKFESPEQRKNRFIT
jgi:hypothetical protein